MRGVSLGGGATRVIDVADPGPGPEEAVVCVNLAGICGTDLEIARGYLAFQGVPGHEFVGTVESAPDPTWLGRRVVGEINVACHDCPTCERGLARHCPNRTVLGIVGRDGAFAERLALPLRNLHAVPDGMPDEVAVFTEPLAAAWEIVEQLQPPPGTRCLVLGSGRLGQLCAAVLARVGSPPVVVGGSRGKRRRLRELGLETFDEAASLPREFDLVVEATGAPEGLQRAVSLVRPRGTVVLKSTYHGAPRSPLTPVVLDEVTVVGSRCGPFEPALRHLVEEPEVTVGLVTASYPLEKIADAFAHAASRDALKVLLVP